MRLARWGGWGGAIALAAATAVVLPSACTTTGPTGLDGGFVTPVGPGCLSAPNGSCAGYSQGTVCPGPPQVCVSCGPGLYTFSQSDCICASGSWACSAPQSGEVTCSTPEGNYVDPACTILYPGPPEAGVDAGVDASKDASSDASFDAASDASDASDGSDGGSDDAAEAGD